MKIVVFSDIHGNSYALKNFINGISALDYDYAAFLGDIFGYYYHQEGCIRLLKSIPNLIWLKGNHDSYAVEAFSDERCQTELIAAYGHSYSKLDERFTYDDIKLVDKKSSIYELESGDIKIGFFHGRPLDPLEGRIYPDTQLEQSEFEEYSVVFVGHTHCKFDRMIGHTRVISPGSLGQPRDGKGYGYVIYDTQTMVCEFHNIDVDNDILRHEIDIYDPQLHKLYDVLRREESYLQSNEKYNNGGNS